jgi:hypothetical protein
MAQYEILSQLRELVECGGVFVPADEATVGEWQRQAASQAMDNEEFVGLLLLGIFAGAAMYEVAVLVL